MSDELHDLLERWRKRLRGQQSKVEAIRGFPGNAGEDGYKVGYRDCLVDVVEEAEEVLEA